MTQLVVGGVFLDLYNDEDIQITYTFDSFESYTPQSSYSNTFRIPSTPKNNQFFETAFEINGYDFDITQKHSAAIYNDGDLFMRGEIRLMKIFNSGDGNKIDYEVMFFSNVRDLFTSIGNKTLQDLNLSELDHDLTMENVKRSWDLQVLSGQTLDPSGVGYVLYPLIDFGNTYNENESVEQVSISQGNDIHITNSSLQFILLLKPNRFKPIISLEYLINKIITEAGYTLDVTTQNLLSNYPFYNVFVSAFGNEARIDTPTESNNCIIGSTNEFYNVTSVIRYNNKYIDYSNNFNTTTYRYVAPKTGNYDIYARLIGDFFFGNLNTVFTLQLRKNGTTILHENIFDYDGTGVNQNNIPLTVAVNAYSLTAGDYIDVRLVISSSNPGTYTSKKDIFEVTLSPSEVQLSPLIEKDYKQIDFLKDIINKFRLTLRIDDETNEVIIKPYNDFVLLEDEFLEEINYTDWTNKLDLSKDVEISPLFYDQPATLNFIDKEDKDWLNDQNNIINKEVYGTLIVDAGNDLLKGSKEIKTNFAPTLIKEMGGTNSLTGGTSVDGRDFMFIPHIYNLEAGETKLLKKPIVPKTRLLYYNGKKSTGKNTSTDNPWYYNLDGDVGSSTDYPLVSPYSVFESPTYTGGSTTLSYDLNWQVEDTYMLPDNEFYIPNRISVYDFFWEGYINTLYNKWSRRVTAYFMLDPEDVKYFNFEKKIYVKGTYYYVEKIHNVVIGKRGSYKVDLIKLLDPIVPSGGYIPPAAQLVWNTTDVFFNVEETFWNG
jgi:hypothetical protein